MQPILGTTYTGHIVGVIEVSCINGIMCANLFAAVSGAAFSAVRSAVCANVFEGVFSAALEDVCADAFTNSSADESESG